MSPAPAEPPVQRWTWMRWAIAIALVFILHVALIFLFGSRKPAAPVPGRKSPSLALGQDAPDNWLLLKNATLFALPDRDGFAGPMWIALPPLPFRRQDWTEPPRWLAPTDSLTVSGLGSELNHFIQTNRFAAVSMQFNLSPPLAADTEAPPPLFAPASTLQIKGALAQRPLLNSLKLRSWPSDDVIAPSVVQVLVDAAGRVVSAVLLQPENFLEDSAAPDNDAGQYAVTLARAALFAPLPSGAGGIGRAHVANLAVGQLVFNWQTIPEPPTNAVK